MYYSERGRIETPLMGCFVTEEGNYLYDVNRNEIIKIPEHTYELLVEQSAGQPIGQLLTKDPVLQALKANGYLSLARASSVRFSLGHDEYAEKLRTSLRYAVLEPTRLCNLNCAYCVYSPGFDGRRNHSAEAMSWDTAKCAIELLLKNSTNEEELSLGFYGGEPLLAWSLIKRCLEYSDNRSTKRVHYSMTTNAALVTDEIAKECAERKVAVTISLDGPKQAHDANRVFRFNGEGTYDATLRGIGILRRAYASPSLSGLLRINAVYGPWSDLSLLMDFFVNPPPEIDGLDYQVGRAVLPLAAKGRDDGESVRARHSNELLRNEWLEVLAEDWPPTKSVNPRVVFLRKMFEPDLLSFYKRCKSPLGDNLPLMGHCAPGLRKLYVDVHGKIHMCEKVSENLSIGDVHRDGIDVGRCLSVTEQYSRFFSARCPDCVMCRLCTGCSASYCDEDGEVSDKVMERHCIDSFDRWKDVILTWTQAIETNPTCFDYMHQVSVS